MQIYGFSLVGPKDGSSAHDAISDTLGLIELGDRVGIDGWFVAEHHGQPQLSLSSAPLVLLAAAAQRTERLRLGVMASVLPFHHPLRLAEELAMLDVLSNGRLEAGFGRGHLRAEQAMFGTERTAAADMFDAAIDIVKRLLAGETVDIDTPWWQGDGACLVPPPVQVSIPSWLTAVSEASVDKAAALGFSCATALLPRADADARIERYRKAWNHHHPDVRSGRFAITATVAVAESRGQAIAATRAEVARRQAHFAQAVSDTPLGDDPTYEDHKNAYTQFVESSFDTMVADGLMIAGDPAACRDQLAAIKDRGIEAVICIFHSPGADIEVSRASLSRFMADVVPTI
jgi:alkanesulfonate monooxygenase SsuD/methylene tetrahydromethanopterin reductase-like flavin-dependent oxidoreductase (luciferase family)